MGTSAAELIENPGCRPEAIEYHYDTGNEFFSLWLDPSMTYSGAAFQPGDTLEQAQLRKIEHHIRESRAAGSDRILEIGSGWGSTLSRAMKAHGVKSAVGLTLSPSQAEYVRRHHVEAGGLSNLQVRVESWTDHRPPSPYDAIISIGAIEHFARPELTRSEKVASYRTFFELCHQWLKPGGYFSLQSVTWNKMNRADASEFMLQEVFPETDPPELSELSDAMKGLFELRGIVCDPEGYTETLTAWHRNLRRRRTEAVAISGEEVTARFERYLSLCSIAFHIHNLNLMRLTLRRID